MRYGAGVLGLLLLASCASDPAEWRPARGVGDLPAAKDAYRIPQAQEGCRSIGVVHAEGSTVLADIATTAARHGGTHFVVRGDVRDTHYETTGLVSSGVLLASTQAVTDRATWAEVFRCEP